MKFHFEAFLAISILSFNSGAQSSLKYSLTNYEVNSSIRAIEVVDENTVWFAGSNGIYGHTADGGQSWVIDSLSHPLVPKLEFRSIASTSNGVFILSVGTPAILFKIIDEGRDWQIVYQEDHPKAFYDAMAFWDDQNGIAMGDPTEGCISVIITKDGGNTWIKVPCNLLPPAAEGEAAFAASNSNIALFGNHAWIVTGGSRARVLHTPDQGSSWEIFNTPIVEGGAMTGIYSVDFYDQNNGIIFGGDWNDKERNTQNKAVTSDGGKTWQLVSDGSAPGYRSCVQYIPNQQGKQLIAVGIPGISYSSNSGKSWENLSEESFYTVRFNQLGLSAWLAGKNVISKMTWNR